MLEFNIQIILASLAYIYKNEFVLFSSFSLDESQRWDKFTGT